ncbi:molybdopterin molybdenumtransferase MoeA [Methanoculleus sp. FWC-SCC1]|uniref:Molybdopterin molybdenumtransferase MoeA n=1 Tax=Methanoculleus frigidifontis TaxID=2584085 RepID=A0ABT8M9I3_9EURY|nr:molybdopterin-binding protein [Methanoculleus sp. FWC-SCC1]MDN7024593.1 molybdopterin molybdenumtransferase MoeA [Methanoculleus sp. FWC-SCC1]
MVRGSRSLLPLKETVSLITRSFPKPGRTECVPVTGSVGRVACRPVFSLLTLPGTNIATRDGIAVRSGDTSGASARHPVAVPGAVRVNTGNDVPAGYDAVVMIEDVRQDTTSGAWIADQPAAPWQYVRRCGEEIRKGDLILPAGHRVGRYDIGALTTYGIAEITVDAARIGLIPTGSEVVPLGTLPGPGQVIESNVAVASVWLTEAGATPVRYPIVPDDPDRIKRAIETGVRENDLVLISAGSSAGTRDYTASALTDLGEVLVHGIAIKPGRTALVGKVSEKPVIGLPGNPAAALAVLRELVLPLLASWGFRGPAVRIVRARLTRPLASEPDCDEFVLVTVTRSGDHYVAHPERRGAGMQMAAVRANGYLHIPAAVEELSSGDEVDVRLTKPEEDIQRSLSARAVAPPAFGSTLTEAGGQTE